MKVDKQKLLLAMARMRITDTALCEQSGISLNTLGRIKTGKINPKPVTLGKLAYGLGTQPEDLLADEKE